MRVVHGQVRKSGQATTRDFCNLEAQTYPKRLESKGKRFGSSNHIHPDKRNSVPSCLLLLVNAIYYNLPGE